MGINITFINNSAFIKRMCHDVQSKRQKSSNVPAGVLCLPKGSWGVCVNTGGVNYICKSCTEFHLLGVNAFIANKHTVP